LLVWDPDLATLPIPVGYAGDGQNSQPVIGSPCGQNFFRVEGPDGADLDGDGNNFMQTDLFMVMGKFATRAGVQVTRTNYSREDWDPGVEVFAKTMKTDPPQSLEISGLSSGPAVTLIPGGTDPTGVWQHHYAFINGDFDPSNPVQITNISDLGESGPYLESASIQPLNDMVTIHEAYFYRLLNELEIVATTSDQLSTCPTGTPKQLMAYTEDGEELGELLPGDPDEPGSVLKITAVLQPGTLVPPDKVVVKSCFGGEATRLVDIGRCERINDTQKCVQNKPSPQR